MPNSDAAYYRVNRDDPVYQAAKTLWPEKHHMNMAAALGIPRGTVKVYLTPRLRLPDVKRAALAELMKAFERRCAAIRKELLKPAPPKLIKTNRGICAKRARVKKPEESINPLELK